MYNRFSPQAQSALIASVETARSLGHDTVDSAHLLLGLITQAQSAAERALTGLGVTEERLRKVCLDRRPQVAEEPAGHLPFTREAKRILETAIRQALRHRHTELTTGHLLAATATAADSAGGLVLSDLGVPVAAVEAAWDAPGEDSVEPQVAPTLTELRLGPAPRLPGRGAAALRAAGSLLWFAVVLGVATYATWDTAGPELLLTLTLCLGCGTLLCGLLNRRRAVVPPPVRAALPDEVAAALAGSGLTAVGLRIDYWAAVDRCYRHGRRGLVVLSGYTVADERRLRFVIAHELAHLARNDSLRWLPNAFGLGLASGALLTFSPAAAAVLGGGWLMHVVALSWWAELRCDAIAVRWAGLDCMRFWIDGQLGALRAKPNRTLRVRLRTARDLLVHPPLRWRMAAAAHVGTVR
ncbi:Clp protease N-terminal domain-containing protein [Catellatospora sp. NPDC049609]|uniref:Clp protease N-terminal domain-containing protein n=1 Tax=Catellatospora sp. NPDC049609 TaxID=3155505 RepID=UPI00342777ED